MAIENNELLLDVKNVSKKFPKNLSLLRKYGARELVRNLIGFKKENTGLREGEFWAVNNVSFQLRRGESLALIGLNGSGKSTLLKAINNLLLPDSGEIKVFGNIDALIELGTGFHPMLTGRQNIFIKCALNGLSDSETKNIFDDIVDFSELADFIDMPVKNYSSGMFARLGFATAIFGKPDILLIDEVLSVGDFRFRQKCLDKISEVKKDCAIIFVSHSLATVKMFCDRGIVLEKGKMLYEGSADSASEFYSRLYEPKKKEMSKESQTKTALNQNTGMNHAIYGESFFNPEKISEIELYWSDEFDNQKLVFERHERIFLNFSFEIKTTPKNLLIGIPIWDSNHLMVAAFASDANNIEFLVDKKGKVSGRLEIENIFNRGKFRAVAAISDGPEYYFRNLLPEIEICNHNHRELGIVTPNHKWYINP